MSFPEFDKLHPSLANSSSCLPPPLVLTRGLEKVASSYTSFNVPTPQDLQIFLGFSEVMLTSHTLHECFIIIIIINNIINTFNHSAAACELIQTMCILKQSFEGGKKYQGQIDEEHNL